MQLVSVMNRADRRRILAEAREAIASVDRTLARAALRDLPAEPREWRLPEPEPPKRQRGLDTMPVTNHSTTDWSGWERWLAAHLQRERTLTNKSVGFAIGKMLREQREECKQELSAEVRQLRIELSNLETTLAELRSIIASERAPVIDLPALPPRSRTN
jgi:hypothetical protein